MFPLTGETCVISFKVEIYWNNRRRQEDDWGKRKHEICIDIHICIGIDFSFCLHFHVLLIGFNMYTCSLNFLWFFPGGLRIETSPLDVWQLHITHIYLSRNKYIRIVGNIELALDEWMFWYHMSLNSNQHFSELSALHNEGEGFYKFLEDEAKNSYILKLERYVKRIWIGDTQKRKDFHFHYITGKRCVQCTPSLIQFFERNLKCSCDSRDWFVNSPTH